MSRRLALSARGAAAGAAVAVLGLLAVGQGWLAARRPAPPELAARLVITVASAADDGPGSLREAIFTADRAAERARIVLAVPRIELASPLPPLVNPEGVVIDAPAGCEIDASALGVEPVLDVAAPRSVLRGLTLRHAVDSAILVRADGVLLSGLTIEQCGEGVHAAEGVQGLTVTGSVFSDNGIGVRLTSPGRGTTLRDNRFAHHDRAAVWAVSPRPASRTAGAILALAANRFAGDRVSLVLAHVTPRVEANEIVEAQEIGLYLVGRGEIRGNRVRGGSGVGIFADDPEGARIVDNELDANRAVGLLLRAGRNSVGQRNRIYRNGYGVATVFGEATGPNTLTENLVTSQRFDGFYVVGGSPVLSANRILGNRGAGLRVLDFVPWDGAVVSAEPLLEGNRLEDNGIDQPVQGAYHAEPPPDEERG